MPILLMTVVLSGLGFGLVLPGMPFVAENLGASPALATFILGLYAWGQFLSIAIWGRLSDRFGRKPVLVITSCGGALSYLLMAFAPNVWVLASARALSGLMGGLAPAMAYVSDITPPEKRAQGMGWAGASMSLGFVIGPALGGVLGGSTAVTASLRLPGLVAFAISCATTLATVFLLRESLPAERRARAVPDEAQGSASGLRELLGRPVVARVLVLGFSVYFAMAMFETIFPFWAKAQFQWGPREVGLSFTCLAAVVGLMQGFVVGRLTLVFGEGRLAGAGLAAYASGLLWMTRSPTWSWMLVGIMLTAAGSGAYLTAMLSFVSKLAGATERGLVLGTYQSASWAGRSLGPVLSGSLFTAFGPHSPVLAAAAIMLPCIALLMTIHDPGKR
jgi:MFS family permease